MLDTVIISGQGGQGALLIGQMLAYAGLDQGYEVSWMPSYGAEMRGGTANCAVSLSDKRIATPIVKRPLCALVMNTPSFDKFEPAVLPGGWLVVNSDMAEGRSERNDIQSFYLPADSTAERAGNPKGVNMLMLGAYLALSNCLEPKSMEGVAANLFSGPKARFLAGNLEMIRQGYELVRQEMTK